MYSNMYLILNAGVLQLKKKNLRKKKPGRKKHLYSCKTSNEKKVNNTYKKIIIISEKNKNAFNRNLPKKRGV